MHLARLFFILFIIISAFAANAQRERVNTFYDYQKLIPKESYYVLKKKSNILDSLYLSYYQNGNLKIKGYYNHNKASGPWEYYFQDGSIKAKGNFVDNMNSGHWIYYYENGSISLEGEMVKGKKNGLWTYNFENGMSKSSGNYVNDQKTGIWNYFFEDNTFKAQAEFIDGKGNYKEYFPGGSLKSEGPIIDNRSNGLWKYYYENGVLKAEGYEKDGLKQGMWKFYHPNGGIASEGVFEGGKSLGNWKYFYENGQLSAEGQEIDGQKDGYWKLYNTNGAFKGEGEFAKGEGPYKEYYESGKLKAQGQLKNNKNDGAWKYYYETGELEGEVFYNQGKGNYFGYYPDQKKKMEGQIDNGNKVGLWKLYNEDGSLAGYYKTYYEGESPVFDPVKPLKQDSIKDTILPYHKPEIKIPRKKSRYFAKKVNELEGLIISTNPLAPIFGSLPLSIEYYLQERLGYEANFTFINKPFFAKAEMNEVSKTGYSLYLRQKFYQPDEDKGMLYFGHEIRYTTLNHRVTYADSTFNPPVINKYHANETLYEYSVIVGDRIMRDAHNQGYSFDVFVGLGIGYRIMERNTMSDKLFDKVFDLRRGRVSIPIRFGVNFGYCLNRKKLAKSLGMW